MTEYEKSIADRMVRAIQLAEAVWEKGGRNKSEYTNSAVGIITVKIYDELKSNEDSTAIQR